MPTQTLPKWSAATALTITLGSLASSTSGVGRQGTIIDNTTTRYARLFLYPKIKLGTSPSSGIVTIWLIRDDGSGSPNRTDNAGASDAALTVVDAVAVMTLPTKASPATGDTLVGDVVIEDPGPKWTIAVTQNTGVALDSTNGNHVINWVGEDPEFQA